MNWNYVYNNLLFPIEMLLAEALFLLTVPRKRHFQYIQHRCILL